MKENSLISKLYKLVKEKEFVSINGINDLTEQLGYKISCGERRMRDLVSKELVKKITDDGTEHGVVIGYKPVPLQKPEIKPIEYKQDSLFPTQPKKLNPYGL